MSALPAWYDREDERTARVVWSRLAEPNDLAALALVARVGAAPALSAVVEGRLVGVQDRWRVRLPGTDPRRDLATLQRFGGRLLVPSDPGWPAGLWDLGDRAPFCLWARGPLEPDQACARAVAVVGARASTGYGDHVAGVLAAESAQRGVTVVSGAAFGIDAAAHRGTLAVAGATVAVLACGVDRPYPRAHERLIAQIAEQGAVVSEVPPGSSPTRWRFVQRNRLIAALGAATVVVEAGWRSGASITAREAATLGRPVGAVPGPVTSPTSAGCHRLLRDGAICVTEAADLLELVAPIGTALAPVPVVPPAVHDGLPEEDLRVLDALPLRSAAASASIGRAAGLEPSVVRAALGRLELLGLAVGEADRWRRAPLRSKRGGGTVSG